MLLRLSGVLDGEVAHRLTTSLHEDCAHGSDEAADVITGRLRSEPLFQLAVQPRRLSGTAIRRYDTASETGFTIGPAVIGEEPCLRVDVGIVIFLSSREDYEGGAFTVAGAGAEESVEAAAGECIVYAASAAHKISPIARGTLWTAELWAQSLVRDEVQREVLYDLGYSLQLVELFGSERASDLARLQACHRNLLRMWAEP